MKRICLAILFCCLPASSQSKDFGNNGGLASWYICPTSDPVDLDLEVMDVFQDLMFASNFETVTRVSILEFPPLEDEVFDGAEFLLDRLFMEVDVVLEYPIQPTTGGTPWELERESRFGMWGFDAVFSKVWWSSRVRGIPYRDIGPRGVEGPGLAIVGPQIRMGIEDFVLIRLSDGSEQGFLLSHLGDPSTTFLLRPTSAVPDRRPKAFYFQHTFNRPILIVIEQEVNSWSVPPDAIWGLPYRSIHSFTFPLEVGIEETLEPELLELSPGGKGAVTF